MRQLRVTVVPNITSNITTAPLDQNLKLNLPRDIHIAETEYKASQTQEIDILIGNDYYLELVLPERHKLAPGLYALNTSLGWIVSGRTHLLPAEPSQMSTPSLLVIDGCQTESNVMDKPQLERFWDLETIGIMDSPHISDDETAQALFSKAVTFENGRYNVSWPWKPDRELPDNYMLAKGRLTSLIRRLRRDPDMLKRYDDVIQDQLTKGIIEEAPPVQSSHRLHYLPHHHVISPSSTTTKLRIVYDGSAKTTKSKNSLNECLFRGPVILQDLAGILLRFRLQQVAITADIEKAFLQVSLHQMDRDTTRFLWLKSVNDQSSSQQIQEYRFTRVPFGVISRPFLLAATINHHLKTQESLVAEAIRRDLYVDNLITGVASSSSAVSFYKKTKALFAIASMNIRCWNSNSDEFRKTVPKEDLDKRDILKTLGLIWNRLTDTLAIPVPDRQQLMLAKTKREVLHGVAAIYDPLGLFSPVTISGKLLLQTLWKEHQEWDEPLADIHLHQWHAIVDNLSTVSTTVLPRCIGLVCDSAEVSHQLLCFTDASAIAYAAAVYLRTHSSAGVTSTLVFSKNRLAPIRTITLPRLELMGVVLGIRCLAFVREHLQCLNLASIDYLWTDSKCVMAWLSTTKVLPVFVRNRIDEIRAHPAIVRYVSSAENPADLPSRGIDAKALDSAAMWWHGPAWLFEPKEEWPQWHVQPLALDGPLDSTKIVQPTIIFETKLNVLERESQEHRLDDMLTRVSHLSRLLRVTAWIQRFLMNLRHSTQRRYDGLTAKEIATANVWWIQHVQKHHFSTVLEALLQNKKQHSLIRQLDLFLCSDGILRCGGRLRHADLPSTANHPILLPKEHPFTVLVIQDIHQKLQHVGTSHTLSHLRRKYWILRGRQAVKTVLSQCLKCRRYHGPAFRMPHSPDLPPERVTRSTPFAYTAVDYFGPLYCVDREPEGKVWVVLYTCLAIRAIHLELATDMTADQFLLTLRRFIARRGTPSQMLSDNAPQFKVADEMLQSLWSTAVYDDKVQSYLSDKGISWQYIPAHAPWMGGIYERLIGIVKSCLRKSLGRARLRTDQLSTLLTEIEAVVNTRPIVYVGSDDHLTLSPADLLQQHTTLGLPDITVKSDDPDFVPPGTRINMASVLLDAWRRGQNIVNNFWKLWREDYLTALREKQTSDLRKMKPTTSQQPHIGDVVQVYDETFRGSWKVGRITRVLMSRDGKVRAAEVQLANGHIIDRPTSKLYPLESSTPPTTAKPESERRQSTRLAAIRARERLASPSLY